MTVGPQSLESSTDDIAQAVFEQVRLAAPGGLVGEISLETSLFEVGLDSIARMDVLNRLEETFAVRFMEDELYDLETCGDLVEGIVAKRAKGGAAKSTAAPEPAAKPQADQPADREILPECFDVARFPECVALEQRLAAMAAEGMENPFFLVNQRVRGSTATINDREVVSYASFNYLGMATDPRVTAAAKEAIDQFGTSSTASRLVGGDYTIVNELDAELAEFIGAEAAMVFSSGHGTNESLFGHLFGKEDLILYDELAHNSIVQGAMLSQAARRPFPHNDVEFLDKLLADIRGKYRRVVVAVEGVYSMDGDYPDLPRFIQVKKRHRALLFVDEAHSLGTMGPGGRGICEHFNLDPADGDIWMGTISKALASGGGYLAGRKELIEYLKYTTPSFVFATGVSPPNAAAALASLRLVRQEPDRVIRLQDRSRLFLELARQSWLDTGNSRHTPIVPVILGDSTLCVQVSAALLAQGVNARPILYPAVPEAASRIRFFITAAHTEQQIRHAVETLTACLAACK